jgi:hypothetical protein
MNLSLLFVAIVSVESSGGKHLIGDQGRSVGPAQIQEIVVRDVNRIAGTHYTASDRFDFAKSREMFRIYTDHYGKKYGVPVTDEVRARIWNGGPNGPNKASTEKYWAKVKSRL